jgi:hypothetical protein
MICRRMGFAPTGPCLICWRVTTKGEMTKPLQASLEPAGDPPVGS